MLKNKQYGLVLPKKDQVSKLVSKPSAFDDDSDDEKKSIEKSIKNQALKNLQKKQTRLEMERAVNEDPTVFEYDNIYDDMQRKKETQKALKTKDKTPKYIASLMKTAEHRKKEYERRTERKIQKEREEEGEEFADKEAFVTLSYKKKMEEMQEEEERERIQQELEARNDVTKQEDLSGFYRHLLHQTTDEGAGNTTEEVKVQVKEEKLNASDDEKARKDELDESVLQKAKAAMRKNKNTGHDDYSKPRNTTEDINSEFSVDSESSSPDSSDEEVIKPPPKEKKSSSSTRKRKKTRTESKSHKSKNSKPEKRRSKESRHDSSASDSNNVKNDYLKIAVPADIASTVVNEPENVIIPKNGSLEEPEKLAKQCKKNGNTNGNIVEDEESLKKRELDSLKRVKELFQKRNVGDAFESARDRYLARKSAREMAKTVFSVA